MISESSLVRVSRGNPCLICGKPDWCGRSTDGVYAICMRISEGSIKTTGNGGSLHVLQNSTDRSWRPTMRVLERSTPARQFGEFSAECVAALNSVWLTRLAEALGVSELSLAQLGIGWAREHKAWSFPMKDESGLVQGVRLRSWRGGKWSVKGGHEGLFIPIGLDCADLLLITEGPTDTAALLDLGFIAVGRPSAKGGKALLVRLICRIKPLSVVIMADSDSVGIEGAERFAHEARLFVRQVKIITPPSGIKDTRAWKQTGATHDDIVAAIESAPMQGMRIGVSR